MRGKRKKNAGGSLWCVLRGMLLGLFTTLVLVLIFALVLKMTGWGDEVIPPVNQGIKIVSILAGAIAAAWGCKERSWMMGGLSGLIYMLAGYVLFAFLQGRFEWTPAILSDGLMGFIGGIIGGIFGANLKPQHNTATK